MPERVTEKIEWNVRRDGDFVVIDLGEDELWLKQFEAKDLVKAIMGHILDIENSHWGLK